MTRVNLSLEHSSDMIIMTETSNLQDQLVKLLEKELHLIVPTAATDLFESGSLDSLVFVDLLLLLEREFRITIDMQLIEIEDFQSIESIAAYLVKHTQCLQGVGQVPTRFSVVL
jgi:acyl carrier protein